jgi:hypothetical protein
LSHLDPNSFAVTAFGGLIKKYGSPYARDRQTAGHVTEDIVSRIFSCPYHPYKGLDKADEIYGPSPFCDLVCSKCRFTVEVKLARLDPKTGEGTVGVNRTTTKFRDLQYMCTQGRYNELPIIIIVVVERGRFSIYLPSSPSAFYSKIFTTQADNVVCFSLTELDIIWESTVEHLESKKPIITGSPVPLFHLNTTIGDKWTSSGCTKGSGSSTDKWARGRSTKTSDDKWARGGCTKTSGDKWLGSKSTKTTGTEVVTGEKWARGGCTKTTGTEVVTGEKWTRSVASGAGELSPRSQIKCRYFFSPRGCENRLCTFSHK